MSRKDNLRYLLRNLFVPMTRRWGTGGRARFMRVYFLIMVFFTIPMFLYQRAQENRLWGEILQFVVLSGVVFTVIALLRWRIRRRLQKLLQDPMPNALVGALEKQLQNIRSPEREVYIAMQTAEVYIAYGYTSEAREVLASVSWNSLPPILRSGEKFVEGLLSLFEAGDSGRARQLFLQARRLSDLPGAVPGVESSRRSVRMHLAVAALIEGTATDAERAEAEAAATRSHPMLSQAVAAWGLAVDAYRRRDVARAREMMALVHRITPHCKAFQELPVGISVAAEAT